VQGQRLCKSWAEYLSFSFRLLIDCGAKVKRQYSNAQIAWWYLRQVVLEDYSFAFTKSKDIRLFFFLLLCPTLVLAQYSSKKVIVEGKGSPVVLLAGGRWDMQSFSRPAAALSGNHIVIRMEHFNVQYADERKILPSGYSLQQESAAIARTLDSLEIKEPVVVIGWSYGALMAMDFALNHPRRIRQLVLYEPPAFWVAKAKGESPEGMQQMIQLTKTFTPDASISEAQLAQFRCILDSCNTAVIRKHPKWPVWVKQKDRLRGLSVVANHTDSIERLHSFEQPVLILTGKGTVAFHRRINELLAKEFPVVTTKEIAGGHSAPQGAINEFIRAIKEFVK
jgi:pimeloyl-ACP methyl ester carboxylesterase